MFDIRTPLSKIHRRICLTDQDVFTAAPGLWGYLNNDGKINNVASTSTNQAQRKILKPVFGNASMDPYASHDIEVGRVAVIEGVFRALVNSDGFQRTYGGLDVTTNISYSEGQELTVGYRVTTATDSTDLEFSKAADIGKLKPKWFETETVVATVEKYNSSTGQLLFQTVSPRTTTSDIIDPDDGVGAITLEESIVAGEARIANMRGVGIPESEEAVVAGEGTQS